DAAVRRDRDGERIIHEPVHEIDAVTHPLVGDAARAFAIETELEVQTRIEGTRGAVPEPGFPIGILLLDHLHFRTAAPAGPVVVPDDLDLAHLAKRARLDEVVCDAGVDLAAVLRADLHDTVVLQHRVARGFDV